MRTEGNVSKVAICQNCDGFVLACHVDGLDKRTEKEFTEFTNEGFLVKIETIQETKARDFADYDECSNGTCSKIKVGNEVDAGAF
jgi:hypothetical protein